MTLDSGLRRNDGQGKMLRPDIFEHRLLDPHQILPAQPCRLGDRLDGVRWGGSIIRVAEAQWAVPGFGTRWHRRPRCR